MEDIQKIRIEYNKMLLNLPNPTMNGTVSFKQTSYKHATLKTVRSLYRKHVAPKGFYITHTFESGGLKSTVEHESGVVMDSAFTAIPTTSDPRQDGSWSSYLRRYHMCVLLDLIGQEDTDGNVDMTVDWAARIAEATSVKQLNAIYRKMSEDEQVAFAEDLRARKAELS